MSIEEEEIFFFLRPDDKQVHIYSSIFYHWINQPWNEKGKWFLRYQLERKEIIGFVIWIFVSPVKKNIFQTLLTKGTGRVIHTFSSDEKENIPTLK